MLTINVVPEKINVYNAYEFVYIMIPCDSIQHEFFVLYHHIYTNLVQVDIINLDQVLKQQHKVLSSGKTNPHYERFNIKAITMQKSLHENRHWHLICNFYGKACELI